MTDQLFAITDIETTGGGISGNRVTEICIVLYKNGSVQDKYISLVNPQCPIPRYITTLTGIDNETVANAPSFRDIAKTIDHFTDRKSTRLNSSHVRISYAVFCLK